MRLKGDAAFQKAALAALKRIQETSTGTKLLKKLGHTGRMVTIRLGGQESAGAVTYYIGDGDSVVLWDPGYELKNFPPFLFLYHELVHALHEARNERILSGKAEERRTIGLKEFAKYELSENALRRELKIPLRHKIEAEEFRGPSPLSREKVKPRDSSPKK